MYTVWCCMLHIRHNIFSVLIIVPLGVQLVLREYDFTAQPSFTEEDIYDLLPIIRLAQFKVNNFSYP